MLEYCVGIKRNALFFSLLSFAVGLACLATIFTIELSTMGLGLGLLGIGASPFIYLNLYGYPNRFYKRNMNRYSTMYPIETIESEFEQGRTFVHGCIIAGDNFVFGKGTGQFIAYNDIQLIRLHLNETQSSDNSFRDQTWFIEAKVYSEYKKLCKLKRYPEQEYMEFVEYISFIAPDIQIDDKIKMSATQFSSAHTTSRPF